MASLLELLEDFIQNHAPICPRKCVRINQVGELHGNPKVRKLFELCGNKINPFDADTSHQNNVVQHHLMVGIGVRGFLIVVLLITSSSGNRSLLCTVPFFAFNEPVRDRSPLSERSIFFFPAPNFFENPDSCVK